VRGVVQTISTGTGSVWCIQEYATCMANLIKINGGKKYIIMSVKIQVSYLMLVEVNRYVLLYLLKNFIIWIILPNIQKEKENFK
jgi:hypothetical protein